MRRLSAAEVLDACERGAAESPAQRALTLLQLAGDSAAETPEQLSVGQRDAHLLALRAGIFGRRLDGLTSCPACREPLEFEIDVSRLAGPATIVNEPLYLEHDGYALELRLPTAADVAALRPEEDLEANRKGLLQRCVLRAWREGLKVAVGDLPEDVEAVIGRELAAADPRADVQLRLVCPECRHESETGFDIVSYFWSELEGWAARLLREVSALASAYGWGEAEVLALSPARRRAYLELGEP